jgi:hypothetical protein
MEIAVTDGIDSVDEQGLAARTGVPVNELARHYASVSDCLTDTYDEFARSLHADFAAAFAAEDDYYGALTLVGETLLARMAERPDEAQFCFVEALRGDHELARLRADSRRRLVDMFAGELRRRCNHEGVPRMQLELLIGAAFQAISTAVSSGNIADLPELMPELTSRAYVFEPVAA